MVQIRLSPAKNIIRIQMNDADTQLPVGGGTFWVIAAENIITMDGTVRYTTGQVVDTIYCDEEGYGESDELYLGAYTVQQVGAPKYYASMTETFTAEVEQRTGALPEVHEVEAEKTQIVLHVADELYADQNIGGARFTVTQPAHRPHPAADHRQRRQRRADQPGKRRHLHHPAEPDGGGLPAGQRHL